MSATTTESRSLSLADGRTVAYAYSVCRACRIPDDVADDAVQRAFVYFLGKRALTVDKRLLALKVRGEACDSFRKNAASTTRLREVMAGIVASAEGRGWLDGDMSIDDAE